MWWCFGEHRLEFLINGWGFGSLLKIYGVEPAESNILNGGKPGMITILLFQEKFSDFLKNVLRNQRSKIEKWSTHIFTWFTNSVHYDHDKRRVILLLNKKIQIKNKETLPGLESLYSALHYKYKNKPLYLVIRNAKLVLAKCPVFTNLKSKEAFVWISVSVLVTLTVKNRHEI